MCPVSVVSIDFSFILCVYDSFRGQNRNPLYSKAFDNSKNTTVVHASHINSLFCGQRSARCDVLSAMSCTRGEGRGLPQGVMIHSGNMITRGKTYKTCESRM